MFTAYCFESDVSEFQEMHPTIEKNCNQLNHFDSKLQYIRIHSRKKGKYGVPADEEPHSVIAQLVFYWCSAALLFTGASMADMLLVASNLPSLPKAKANRMLVYTGTSTGTQHWFILYVTEDIYLQKTNKSIYHENTKIAGSCGREQRERASSRRSQGAANRTQT